MARIEIEDTNAVVERNRNGRGRHTDQNRTTLRKD